ncbi:MAG: hypothetical protein ACRECX_07545 [Methyloceanibacter sp.]|uniref:hypothetical protein n=1 Tax=Methyloceanibacter sp. TaxID=1965321 RepID=UPI003D6CA170
MKRIASAALVCLLALSAAGCAVELPKSALSGFRLAPADEAGKSDAAAPRRDARQPAATD